MKILLLCLCAWAIFCETQHASAQDTNYPPQGTQIPGPAKASDRAAWLRDITAWRNEMRVRAGLTGENYARADLRWTQSSFIQPQSMVEDRYFYDPAQRRYTVDRFLQDLDLRYGAIDAVLLWPVYPNIGIDNRSQFDLLRDLPGGIDGIKRMIEDFHRRRVRVLFPTMPWDTGTQIDPQRMPETLAELMTAVGADGVNGDTFDGVPRTYRIASDATGHPLVFEPEGGPSSAEGLNWNTMSWAYWKYPFVPMISRNKWLEPRHMVTVCDRWSRDKTDNLQAAFFNGVGYESWENVWGIWNGITQRDGEAIRRIARIERFSAPMLASPDWEPHTATVQSGVFASRFPLEGRTVWTLVNRGQMNVAGTQLQLPAQAGMRYFDLWHGVELQSLQTGESTRLDFEIEANGFGAVLAQPQGPDTDLSRLLADMHRLSSKPLQSYPKQWTFLPQHLVDIPPTSPARETPSGMVAIPAASYDFQVSGIEIEGGDDIGVDVQYPWEDSARRQHAHTLAIKRFFVDKYPVTNREFKAFLQATRYRPEDDHNFLKDWSRGTYPKGWDNRPVTWVSLEDARAFAHWAGKRLPHEWEWQYAAQGNSGRIFPWGNDWDPSRMPRQEHGHNLPGPAAVDAHPAGVSPFGVMDLTGNVWQWTDEVVDEHTRAVILRGGGYYRPAGSKWYFPSAYRLDEHGKYLLMAPGKDRSGVLGFRCVKDAA